MFRYCTIAFLLYNLIEFDCSYVYMPIFSHPHRAREDFSRKLIDTQIAQIEGSEQFEEKMKDMISIMKDFHEKGLW